MGEAPMNGQQRHRYYHEIHDRQMREQRHDTIALIFFLGGLLFFMALFVTFIYMGRDFRTVDERIRQATTCDEILDVLDDINRDVGAAELARYRLQQLNCTVQVP
jgi:hypothetical protein